MKSPVIYLVFLIILIPYNTFGQLPVSGSKGYDPALIEEECTIGVANGTATSDQRPLLWKTRDYSSAPNNEVKYNTSNPIKFISVSNAGTATYPWMGVNEHGFAILNSVASDLVAGASGPGNGAVMEYALGNCRTVAEFQDYLDATNSTGRTTKTNFAVIDTTGVAAIFETAGNEYWKYDAANSPNGYVVRTNFAMNGGGTGGIERYDRSKVLINNFYSGDSLNHKSILRYQMRDFSDFDSEPVSVPFADTWITGRPYGYIYCDVSICRPSTVSAAVFHGVLPGELAGYTTMWTILGQTASSIAVPYWPLGNTPVEADGPVTSALCDQSLKIRRELFDYSENTSYIDSYKLLDGLGGGLWTCTFPFEDQIFSDVNLFMDTIRTKSPLPVATLLSKESEIATSVLSKLQDCYDSQIVGIAENKPDDIIDIYPNPFRNEINISYQLTARSFVIIDIYSITGMKIETIFNGHQSAGNYSYRINSESSLYPNGLYLLNIRLDGRSQTYKLVKINGKE